MLLNIEQINFNRHALFTKAVDMKELVAPLAQYGISHLSYERIDADGGIVNLSSMPFIEEIFIKEKFYQNIFGAPYDQYIAGYFLGDFSGFELNFANALCAHNLWHLLMVIRRNVNSTEIFSFAAANDDSSMNHFYMTNLDIFENFILSFKERAAHLISAYESERLLYPNSYDKSILTDKILAQKFSIEMPCLISSQLTKRERECLSYLRQGYTAKMIAKCLDISHRTTEHHLAHIREKLNTHSLRGFLMKK